MQKNWVKKIVICGTIVLLISSGVVSAFYVDSSISSSEKNIEEINLQNQLLNMDHYWDSWSVETVDSFGDVGQYTDIAVTANDIVFISYYDFVKKDLKFARLINNEWSVIVVDSEGDVGQFTSLALDSYDHPHISYYDATRGVLKHAYFNGMEWLIEVIDSDGNVGIDTSMVIESTNQIHISYHDETNADLKYAKSVDNGWDIEVVDSDGDTGELSSITLDKNGNPHISYTNRYDFYLYHAYYVDDNWVIEPVDDTSVLYGSTCITFDPDGFVHILYYDVTPNRFSLKHTYQSNDGWQIETIDPYLWGGFGTGGANIVFDDFGRIHIGYFDWVCQSVDYAWKINDIWNFEFVDISDDLNISFSGSYAALAVDQHGTPHMSYMNYMNLDLKYARKIENRPGVPIPPSGNSRGKPGQMYTFTTTSQDLDNDKIQYGWDWNGDLEVDEWTGFFGSGETCEISHSWNESGSYNIRVIAMDEKGFTNGYHVNENGEFSFWSDSLPITMPYSHNPILQFLEWLFERFPNAFPILRQLLGY